MYRDKLIKPLVLLPHPIIENVIFFDDNVEFCVLTNQEGFECLVGGFFPVFGPVTLSSTDKNDFLKVLSNNSSHDLEDAEAIIKNSTSDNKRKAHLIALLYILQGGGVDTYLSHSPAANKPFYVVLNLPS